MATQSYRERMKAARAQASAQRKAEKAEYRRRLELSCEVSRLALEAVKAGVRASGDRVQVYSHAQLSAMANATISPFLIEQARARIAERNSEHSYKPRSPEPQGLSLCETHERNGAAK